MLLALRKLRDAVDVVHLPVHAHAHESLRAQILEQIQVLALAFDHQRREDHQARVLGKLQDMVDHLRHALRRQHQAVIRAMRLADARVEQPQVVVDFGDGAYGRARIVAGGLLLDRDRRRQALDQVDIRLFHQLQELSRVSRQRFDVAALAFRIERVEGERRLARAGQAGDHDQPVARQIEIDVLQIVRARTAYADEIHSLDGCLVNLLIYCTSKAIPNLPLRPLTECLPQTA